VTIDASTLSPELQSVLASVPERDTPTTAETVRFEGAGTDLEGYLAVPGDATGPLPAVLVFHDWFGMVDHVKVRAEMLARLGYVALAGDIYGADVRPADGDEAASLAGSYYGDVELFRARALANLEKLRADPRVDSSRIAVMGYCFGGSGALEVARSGADVVAFHGGLGTAAPAEKGAVTAPVLVLTGADDPIVPPSAIEAFEDEMRDAGAPDWQIVTYSGALHAFAVPEANSPEQGAAFQETANRRSWQAMRDFLDEVFAA
jgi:dienelactone hydrolase